MSISKAKIKTIKKIKTLKSIQELQRFLGSIKYLRKFIPGISDKIHILKQLLKKDGYGQKMKKNTFSYIKSASQQILFKNYFVQMKNASQYELGGVMIQGGCPVAYSSTSLTPAQSK